MSIRQKFVQNRRYKLIMFVFIIVFLYLYGSSLEWWSILHHRCKTPESEMEAMISLTKWYLFGIWLQYNHLDKSIRLDLHRAPHWHIQAYKRPSRNVFRHILCGIYTWPTLLVDDGGHKCGCGTHKYRHSHTSTPPPQLCSCSKKWSLKRNHTKNLLTCGNTTRVSIRVTQGRELCPPQMKAIIMQCTCLMH